MKRQIAAIVFLFKLIIKYCEEKSEYLEIVNFLKKICDRIFV